MAYREPRAALREVDPWQGGGRGRPARRRSLGGLDRALVLVRARSLVPRRVGGRRLRVDRRDRGLLDLGRHLELLPAPRLDRFAVVDGLAPRAVGGGAAAGSVPSARGRPLPAPPTA